MKHFIIGDVHGAGQELNSLLDKISPTSEDKVILVGDVFDRGIHGHLVWDLIQKFKIGVTIGNHEHKMLNYLLGKRDFLPPHYYYALNLLMGQGVSPEELLVWLESLSLMMVIDRSIIVHAAVNPVEPLVEDVSWNIYGNMPRDQKMPAPFAGDGKKYFWDIYNGDYLVVYGHLVTDDGLPRVRRNSSGVINSVGLDTAACHGGSLSGYCLEDGKFYLYKSGVDWGRECQQRMRGKSPVVDKGLMEFVNNKRDGLKGENLEIIKNA